MEHLLPLLITLLLTAMVSFLMWRSPRPPRFVRVVACILIICSVALLYGGWASYQHNVAVFRNALGGETAKFEKLQVFLSSMKLTGGTLQFYVSKDGEAHPLTLWQAGEVYFNCSMMCLGCGLILLVRSLVRRPMIDVQETK